MTTTTAAPTASDLVETVARPLLAELEQAWNAADGDAFGAAFSDDAVFVDVRGERHHGRSAIAAGHRAILGSIYRGSTVRYQVVAVQPVAPDVVLVHAGAVLDVPTGPLAGTRRSTLLVVADRGDGGWQARAFHNTLVST